MDLAVTCFSGITYATYSTTHRFTHLHEKAPLSQHEDAKCLGSVESVADSQVTRYSQCAPPAGRTYSAVVGTATESKTEDMQMGEKLPIVIYGYQFFSRCLARAAGGSFRLINILCLMSSLSQIKRRRQAKPTGSKVEEEKEQSSEAEQGVRVIKREMEKMLFRVHWCKGWVCVFFMMSCVGLCWRRGIRRSHVSPGQTALFQGLSAR